MKKYLIGMLFLLSSFSAYAAPDIDVSKTVDLPQASHGETVQYTITVINNGDVTATGLQLTDQLPAEVTYISDDEVNGNYNSMSGIWNIGSLAVSAQAVLNIVVVVN